MVLSYVDLKSWCEEFISTFYGVWILSTLVLGKAREERLDSIGREDLIHTMAVAQALVHDCPDNDKIYLGVSHRLRVMGSKPVSRCQFDASWVKANLKIGEAYGGVFGSCLVHEMGTIPCGCKQSCSMSGFTKDDMSIGRKD